MAMSLSRPDPSSPASIADASFGTSRRGFDQEEVRDFLRMVAAEFGRLSERERFLERELQAAQNNPDFSSAPVDDETMTRVLGEETVRVLTTARESANDIRAKAEEAAARLLGEASDEANRVREEADIEASRRRGDAAADAEAELSMAKQQGREMVNEARAYRERVLSELARRRELAREQIEGLIHGRDRLTQAFERARLVAVDVVAEMQPLGEPNEYVNLAPTTGPLPVMIANSPRPDDSVAVDAATSDAPTPEESSPIPEVGGDLRIVGDDSQQPDDTATHSTEHDSDADILVEVTEVPDAASPEIPVSEGDDVGESAADDAGAEELSLAEETTANDGAVADNDQHEAESGDEETHDTSSDDDDVVVDLFARIRADGDVTDQSTADEVSDEQRIVVDDDDQESSDGDGDLVSEVDGDTTADEATSFELRDEVLTPLIVSCAKKLKRVLADEQNEALDALRRKDPVHNLDALLPWVSEHAGRYSDAIAEELLEAVHAGSATSRTTNRKIRKALATESVAVAAEAVERWLVTPLRDRLTQCIVDGDGENPVVTKKVRAVYREWKTKHIDETLDEIVRTAHGRGVLAGFTLDTPIVWEIDERFSACPDCEDNALAGAVAAGTQFPTGDSFAPGHQGCRCLLVAADR